MYEAVRSNYREVSRALGQIERATNTAIRDKNQTAVKALTKVQMLMVSIKAEAALLQILYLPNGIPTLSRKALLQQENALERWRDTVDACFRLHYSVRPGLAIERKLDHDVLARRSTLHELINSELSLMISIRNKLAHGQFVQPMNMTLDRVEPEITRKMNLENALTLKFRDNLIEELAKAMKDLVESPKTFERRFNMRYRSIRDNRAALETNGYGAWVTKVESSRKPFPVLVDEYLASGRFPSA